MTGGNGGIGLGLAEGLAGAGADIAVWARDTAKSNRAVATLRDLGVRAQAFDVDVGDEASVADARQATVDALGGIDICVANAGTMGGGPFWELSLDEWRRVTRVNLDGVFLTVRDCVRQMIDQGRGGAVIAVSSTAAIHGAPMGAPYSAAKAGVLGLVRSLAVALARFNIRVNALVPGWTQTDLASAGYADERFREVTTRRTPVRRWATGSDYRSVGVYLGDRSNTWHTGDALVLDGGYTIF